MSVAACSMASALIAASSVIASGNPAAAAAAAAGGGDVSVDPAAVGNAYYEPLKKMRAIHVDTFGGPEVLQIKTNLIVPCLTPTQVLVRVMYTGVNPVETYIREGQYSR